MEKIVSIVIPTFNMEKYLNRCLDSIVLPEIIDKIEIIIVNDGSTDGSLAIANSYKKKFPQSIVVIDKPNGHYGSCINAALKIAKGKYFRTLDADDLFDSESFIEFVMFSENKNVDMILTNYSKEYPNKKYNKIIIPEKKDIISKIEYDIKNIDFIKSGISNLLVMHTMTYRTQILKNNNYIQMESICYTDTEYRFYPLEYIKNFVYLNIVLYRYNFGVPGQSVSEESISKNKEHCYKIIKRIMLHFETSNNAASNIRNQQWHTIKNIIIMYYYSVLVLNKRSHEDDEKLHKVDDFLRTFNPMLYKSLERYRIYRMIYPIKLWRNKNKYACEIRLFPLLKSIAGLMYRFGRGKESTPTPPPLTLLHTNSAV
jgi:glycosyltransferase involved in cell wall biosynthesis